ncbi:MAG: hypothetical protein IJY24_05560, partial [Clostridia bacterium]|nr:hypothetical protein [Clostridia bacterium]
EVSGYIGRSDNVRKNRNLMNVFLNGRYVKSLTAQAAIERAFTSYIAPECFPTCVLYIKMNPNLVDVNVHPAKLEVKFADERAVFEAVYFSVRSALEKEEYRPELELPGGKPRENPKNAFVPIGEDTRGRQISITTPPPYLREDRGGSQQREQPRVSVPKAPYIENGERPLRLGSYTSRDDNSQRTMSPRDSVELLERYRSSRENINAASSPVIEKPKTDEELPPIRVEQDLPSNFELPSVTDYRYIGEAFDCYVMVEYDGALLIIDKHAAHERVLFEELKKNMESNGSVQSQPLLIPLDVVLGHEQASIIEDSRAELSEIGFDFVLENEKCSITCIPYDISSADAEGLFLGMLDEIVEGRGSPVLTNTLRRERALYQIACKAAIKGGRVYDRAVIEWLIGRLLALPDITVCPHGRPVAYKLTKTELDRQFDRIK